MSAWANTCPSTGTVAEGIGDLDRALSAYENALRHNPHSLVGLQQVAGIARPTELHGYDQLAAEILTILQGATDA